jgi:hypothetical protein
MLNTDDFKKVITKLGLPVPSSERLNKILEVCGPSITDKINLANYGDPAAEEYVTTVLKCASSFCESTLRSALLSHSFEEIFRVGMAQGPIFFRALNAISKKSGDASNARTYLLAYFKEIEPIVVASDPDRLPNMVRSKIQNNVPNSVGSDARSASTVQSSVKTVAQDIKIRPQYVEPTVRSAPEEKLQVSKLQKEYGSYHAYGSKYALCFGEGLAADGKTHIINIDGAPAVNPRQYDWSRKIALQLTMEEMYRFLAVLQIKIASVKFMGHGKNHDKSFMFSVQEGNYFASLSQTERQTMSIQISAPSGIAISTMLLKQIYLNAPHLKNSTIEEMLCTLVKMDLAAIEKNSTKTAA